MQIIDRQTAKQFGLKYYFTGKPCKNGHIAERHIQGMCKQCRIQYTIDNKDTIKENSQRFAEKHREEINAHFLELYYKKREALGIEKHIPYESPKHSNKEYILSQERLKQLLHYDPATGVFTWLKRNNPFFRQEGLIAGCKDKNGYISIKIDGIMYLAHRLVFLYTTGAFPIGHIDHKNHETGNNKIDFLRNKDRSFNMENKRTAIRNKKHSKYLGVHVQNGQIVAKITVKGVRHYLGTFATEELADAAYLDKKRKLHEGCTI